MSTGYVLDSAVADDDLVRTRIFRSLGIEFRHHSEKFRLANRLDFFVTFFIKEKSKY